MRSLIAAVVLSGAIVGGSAYILSHPERVGIIPVMLVLYAPLWAPLAALVAFTAYFIFWRLSASGRRLSRPLRDKTIVGGKT